MLKLPGDPFRVSVSDDVISDLRERLSRSRFPTEFPGRGWRYGTDPGYLRRLNDYWLTTFDWRAWEARINRFEQRMVTVDGLKIHVLVEPGSGPDPMPLLLTHGWPGSFLEFIELIEPLAHPERFGGRIEDAFTVVVPSLPGYGFSDAPPQPIFPPEIAALWSKLMTKSFGFPRYVAQGGDWGSTVTARLATSHPEKLAAIHLNMAGIMPHLGPDAPALTPEESAYLERAEKQMKPESGYQAIQGTKPQTLAYGLTDSPIGLAAWIVEKFHGWTIGGEDRDPPFSMDRLLANVMLYWLRGPSAASWIYAWLYTDRSALAAAPGARGKVPVGLSLFPRDLLPVPPRSFVERVFDVAYMRVFDRGGHFPAMELGDVLIDEIRQFFRAYR